jgi:hypothetical protein
MMDELGGVCGSMEDRRNAYWGFVREREGQRSLPRSRSRWEDIKLGLKAIGREGVDYKEKRRAFVTAVIELYGTSALTS